MFWPQIVKLSVIEKEEPESGSFPSLGRRSERSVGERWLPLLGECPERRRKTEEEESGLLELGSGLETRIRRASGHRQCGDEQRRTGETAKDGREKWRNGEMERGPRWKRIRLRECDKRRGNGTYV
ncbi:hypothetical protein Cni_G09812 [Canna indica]|uniref:Uncharacterized protein n=1 Tax=Canna indica TaxID=4628 RepID=A0AAQ3K4Q0_9LILI|nr:hypothetical protein Cni_G09812 [Canna indica]